MTRPILDVSMRQPRSYMKCGRAGLSMETWALTTKEENNLLTQADELWMGYIISFIHLFNLKF